MKTTTEKKIDHLRRTGQQETSLSEKLKRMTRSEILEYYKKIRLGSGIKTNAYS